MGRKAHEIQISEGIQISFSLSLTFSHFSEDKKDTLILLVCLRAEMLSSSTRMMLLLLLCIGLLSDNRYTVSALRNKEFFLRQTQGDKAGVHPGEIAKLGSIHRHNREDQGTLSGNLRILEEVKKNEVKHGKTQEQKKMAKNSFQSSKRRVRRGSDPIHNKSEPFS